MMHDPTGHPHDERLSALAAGDGDATDDGTLRDHVDACTRCSAVVDDLFSLRAALAQLPDIAPSRPLRLLPTVIDRPTAAGLGGFARRLFAPALVAGLVLLVAGGIGTYVDHGIPLLTSMSAGAAGSIEGYTDGGAAPATAPSGGGATSDNATRNNGETSGQRRVASEPPTSAAPWLVILAAGVVLLLAALVARFVVQPRAG